MVLASRLAAQSRGERLKRDAYARGSRRATANLGKEFDYEMSRALQHAFAHMNALDLIYPTPPLRKNATTS